MSVGPDVNCKHCLETYSVHADDKCLWDITYFDAARCYSCHACHDYTARFTSVTIIADTRYFLCGACDWANVYREPFYRSRIEFIHILIEERTLRKY